MRAGGSEKFPLNGRQRYYRPRKVVCPPWQTFPRIVRSEAGPSRFGPPAADMSRPEPTPEAGPKDHEKIRTREAIENLQLP